MKPSVAAVLEQGVIAVLRTNRAEDTAVSARQMLRAGFRAVSVTLRSPGAVEAIAELSDELPRGAFVGAGMVTSLLDAVDAIDAGASFVVTPYYSADIVDLCRGREVAVFPGVATPGEMVTARDAGADLVKIFPANLWSPQALRVVLTALPDLKVLVAGGIRAESAPEWIAAGAVAVELGDALAERGALTPDSVNALLNTLQEARSNQVPISVRPVA